MFDTKITEPLSRRTLRQLCNFFSNEKVVVLSKLKLWPLAIFSSIAAAQTAAVAAVPAAVVVVVAPVAAIKR